MKKKLLTVIFSLIGIVLYAQNGTMVVNLPTPNPIPVGGTATGTFTLRMNGNAAGDVLRFTTGNPAFPITSITTIAPFLPWNLDDPTAGYTETLQPLAAGSEYVFTYVITPTGTETDLTGTNLQASYGFIVGNTGTNVTLPVSLASFVVAREGAIAQLSWSTTMEAGAPTFEVNHSTDSKSWKKIGTINSRGIGTGITNYAFSHPNPASGINYYKLKIVEANGSFDQSEIRSLDFGNASVLAVYPNPTAERVFISNSDKIASVKLFNSSGRVVLQQDGYKSADGISLKQLPEGVYFVQVSHQNGSVSSQKVVVSGL